MSDLLQLALNAHGGLDRWREVSTIRARASASGFFFSSKGYANSLTDVGVSVSTREQWTALEPFTDCQRRAICTPSRTVIETMDKQTLEARDNPRDAFKGHTADTPWDDLHLAYFLGYASWNYFNEPFILTLPGFVSEELEPWQENGDTWRRLKVTFPDNIAAHCADQIFYFNADGLLMRMDYSPYVRGSRPAAHYLLDHKNVGGLVLPGKRRVYRRDPSGHRIPEPVLIAIDYADMQLG